MVNLRPGNSSSTFRINNKPYQKGEYEAIISGNLVGITRLSDYITLVTPQDYSQWTDDTDTPYASLVDLVTDLEELFFLNKGAINFSFVANNYTELTTNFPTASIGSLAYVYNSQGTAWLPGTMGGTYYPDGIYFYSGAGWVSSRNAIAGELETLIDDVASLEANKAEITDPRFPSTNEKNALQGTNGTPSNTNRYVTDSDPRNTNSRPPSGTTDGLPEGTTNLYFTVSRVLATLLTGLNTSLSGVIIATDSILIAFGKIQNQITAHVSNTSNPHNVTKTQVGLGNVPNVDATNPANIVQDSTHRFATDTEKATWNAKQNALGFTPENAANKNQVNGYAGLDSGGLIPAALLPSYVDDVLEFANLAAFPATGETGKIYVALDTGKIYRWSGSVYIEISGSPGSTDAVPEGATNLYFTAARVRATVLTGLSTATSAVITATDTVLSAFGKLQAQINSILATTVNGKPLSGNVTLTTTDIAEGTNLYFTAARVLATVITGVVFTTNSAITATDTLLVALGKIQAQINALILTAPTSGQKDALVGNNGTPGTGNRYVTESGLAAAFTQVGNNVTRTLNNAPATGFLVSATKYSYVRYVIAITCSVSLSGSQAGDVFLEVAPTGTAAGGTWTQVDQGGFSWSGTLIVGLTLNPTLRVSIAGFVAPNFDVRIRFSGTGTGAYVSGRENILN